MEAAALGRVHRGRNISVQHDTVHLHVGIGIGDRREECLRIRVQGVVEDNYCLQFFFLFFFGARVHGLVGVGANPVLNLDG